MTPEIMLGTNFLSLEIRVLMEMKIRNVDAIEAIIILYADKNFGLFCKEALLFADGWPRHIRKKYGNAMVFAEKEAYNIESLRFTGVRGNSFIEKLFYFMNLNWKVEVVLGKMNFNIEELKDAIMDTFDKNFVFGDDAQFDAEAFRCIKREIMNAETLTDIFDAMKISSDQLGNDPSLGENLLSEGLY